MYVCMLFDLNKLHNFHMVFSSLSSADNRFIIIYLTLKALKLLFYVQ